MRFDPPLVICTSWRDSRSAKTGRTNQWLLALRVGVVCRRMNACKGEQRDAERLSRVSPTTVRQKQGLMRKRGGGWASRVESGYDDACRRTGQGQSTPCGALPFKVGIYGKKIQGKAGTLYRAPGR